jgi:hypothetical protein
MERRRHCRSVAENSAERWRFSGGRDSETGEQWRDPCGALGTLAFGVGP